MTKAEEEIVEALSVLYESMYDCESKLSLTSARKVVEPILHKYECDVLRRVMRQRAKRREREIA